LSDGGKGSREKEQGREEEEVKPAEESGLLSAIQQYVPPSKPPFIMEIVEAQDVREVQFDPETGRPIRDESFSNGSESSGEELDTDLPTKTTSGGKSSEAQVKDLLKKFPIKFD
jgi:hypothetical protein